MRLNKYDYTLNENFEIWKIVQISIFFFAVGICKKLNKANFVLQKIFLIICTSYRD